MHDDIKGRKVGSLLRERAEREFEYSLDDTPRHGLWTCTRVAPYTSGKVDTTVTTSKDSDIAVRDNDNHCPSE